MLRNRSKTKAVAELYVHFSLKYYCFMHLKQKSWEKRLLLVLLKPLHHPRENMMHAF